MAHGTQWVGVDAARVTALMALGAGGRSVVLRINPALAEDREIVSGRMYLFGGLPAASPQPPPELRRHTAPVAETVGPETICRSKILPSNREERDERPGGNSGNYPR